MCGGYDRQKKYEIVKFRLEENQRMLRRGETGHPHNWVWFCGAHAQVALPYSNQRYSEVKETLLTLGSPPVTNAPREHAPGAREERGKGEAREKQEARGKGVAREKQEARGKGRAGGKRDNHEVTAETRDLVTTLLATFKGVQ
jgi:hypothetical protein